MIRYPITQAELEAAIETEKPGWLAAAKAKTEVSRAARDFNEPSGKNSWSQIKGAFMKLQSNKCAYCERKLGSAEFSKGEHDIEHYRPKNAVAAWPSEKVKARMKQKGKASYAFPTGEASEQGYYLLAYNPTNYATACTACNSSLKSSFFPIAAGRSIDAEEPTKLKREKPFIIFPIGTGDDDPEELITFTGVLPVPTTKRETTNKHRRARVTIDFFELDTRDDLLEMRAQIIANIWLAFTTLQDAGVSAARRRAAQKIIDLASSTRFQQTNCARSFLRLCQQNPAIAEQFADAAVQMLG